MQVFVMYILCYCEHWVEILKSYRLVHMYQLLNTLNWLQGYMTHPGSYRVNPFTL